MKHEKAILKQRTRRQWRVRRAIRMTAGRPRLSVFRSHNHIYCQLIDDRLGRTVASASTRDKEVRASVAKTGNKEAAGAVGKAIAQRALAAGVTVVCLDRGPYKYHGRVAALADAAREAGLKF